MKRLFILGLVLYVQGCAFYVDNWELRNHGDVWDCEIKLKNEREGKFICDRSVSWLGT